MDTQPADITPGRPLRAYDKQGRFRDYSTDELVGKGLNRFLGWECGAGAENLHINMDGDIFGASCKISGKLGNVFEDFTIPTEWLRCTRQFCSCGADLFVPKAKNRTYRPLLKRTAGEPRTSQPIEGDIEEMAGIERTHAANNRQIFWEIGRRCNYDCSYCWPWIHNNTQEHKTIEQLISATQKLEEKFIRGTKVNFIISGGEPTINPAFMDWLRYISGLGHHVSMHSNGSRLAEYYREIIHLCDLNLSVHFEFWNKEKFLRLVSLVTGEKVAQQNKGTGHLEVKIMMTPGKRLEALALEEDLRKIEHFTDYCTWAIVPVRTGRTGEQIMPGYDSEDFAMFGDRV